MKKSNLSCAGAALILCISAASGAQAITINSTVHGTVFDSNNDSVPDFIISDVVQAGNTLTERGIYEFGISSLTGPVSNATLNLPLFNNRPPGGWAFQVYGYTGDGTLSVSDHSTSGSTLLGAFNTPIGCQIGCPTQTFDVTDFINVQIASGDPAQFAGFQLLWASSLINFVIFDRVGFTPFATMSATLAPPPPPPPPPAVVPLPAALPLFGTGLAVMGFIGWRRKRRMAEAAFA